MGKISIALNDLFLYERNYLDGDLYIFMSIFGFNFYYFLVISSTLLSVSEFIIIFFFIFRLVFKELLFIFYKK